MQWRARRSVVDGKALVVLISGDVVLEHRRGKESKEGLNKKSGNSQSMELTARRQW
jgi:hypothetical protein